MLERQLAELCFTTTQEPLRGHFVRYRQYRMLFPIREEISDVFQLKKMLQSSCHHAGAKVFVILSIESA